VYYFPLAGFEPNVEASFVDRIIDVCDQQVLIAAEYNPEQRTYQAISGLLTPKN
jgi:hypothetical protein